MLIYSSHDYNHLCSFPSSFLLSERTPPAERKPRILEKDLKNETARPGDDATFVCSAISKGYPTFNFLKWKAPGNVSKVSYTFDLVDFSKSKFLEIREAAKPHKESRRIYTHRFVIHNVTLPDEGKYTCLVGNSAGWVHTHAFLTVDIQGIIVILSLRSSGKLLPRISSAHS